MFTSSQNNIQPLYSRAIQLSSSREDDIIDMTDSVSSTDLKASSPRPSDSRRNRGKRGSSGSSNKGIHQKIEEITSNASGSYPLRATSEYSSRRITRVVDQRTGRLAPLFVFRNVVIKATGFRYSKYSADWVQKIGHKLAVAPQFTIKGKGNFDSYNLKDLSSIFDLICHILQFYCTVSNYQVLAKNLENNDLSSNELLATELQDILLNNYNINSLTVHAPLQSLKKQLNRCFLPKELVEFVKEMSTPVWASQGGRESLIFPSVWLPLYRDLRDRSPDEINVLKSESFDSILFPTDPRFSSGNRDARYRLVNMICQMEMLLDKLFKDDDLLYDFSGICDEMIPSHRIFLEDGRDTQLPYRFKTKGESFAEELAQKFDWCDPGFHLDDESIGTTISKSVPVLKFSNQDLPNPLDVIAEGRKSDTISGNQILYDSNILQLDTQSEHGMNINPSDLKYFSWTWSDTTKEPEDGSEYESAVLNLSGIKDFTEGFVIYGPNSFGYCCPYGTKRKSFEETIERGFVFGDTEMKYLSIGLKSGIKHDDKSPMIPEETGDIVRDLLDKNGELDETLNTPKETKYPEVYVTYSSSEKFIKFLVDLDKQNKLCFDEISDIWISEPLDKCYNKRVHEGLRFDGIAVELIKDFLKK